MHDNDIIVTATERAVDATSRGLLAHLCRHAHGVEEALMRAPEARRHGLESPFLLVRHQVASLLGHDGLHHRKGVEHRACTHTGTEALSSNSHC